MSGDYQQVLWEVVEPHVARLTLNRPERLNAYTPTMCHEIEAALRGYEADDELRALVLTGAGRGFCTGGDVAGDAAAGFGPVTGRPLGRARELREDMHAVALRLLRLDKPVIAAVNGAAVAGGLTLALLCDLRVAAAGARLGDTAGRVGLLPDEGGAWLFPRFMGFDHALRMVALAEVYDAERARELGLVTEVVPDDLLAERALELARAFAARSPIAVRVAKQLLRSGLESTFEQSLADAQLAVMVVNPGQDAQEGLRAFQEKRPPRFPGR